jgi:hypothetical protein
MQTQFVLYDERTEFSDMILINFVFQILVYMCVYRYIQRMDKIMETQRN